MSGTMYISSPHVPPLHWHGQLYRYLGDFLVFEVFHSTESAGYFPKINVPPGRHRYHPRIRGFAPGWCHLDTVCPQASIYAQNTFTCNTTLFSVSVVEWECLCGTVAARRPFSVLLPKHQRMWDINGVTLTFRHPINRRKLVPVALCRPYIPHGLSWK